MPKHSHPRLEDLPTSPLIQKQSLGRLRTVLESPEPVKALERTANSLARGLAQIDHYAKRGSIDAAEYLFLIACHSIEVLRQLQKERPLLTNFVASRQITWPALVSTNKIVNKRTTSHISKLTLGRRSGIKLSKSRWSFESNYTKAAFDLLDRVYALQEAAERARIINEEGNPHSEANITRLCESVNSDASQLWEISNLGKLTRKSFPRFRHLLKQLYLEITPRPELKKAFKNVKRHENRNTKPQQQAKIVDLILQRFWSLLPP